VLNAVSSSFALTASSADNLLVRNTLTAQTLVVQTITSSVDFVTGSTQFGTLLSNTHVFSGSVSMNPGGLFVSSSGLVGIGTTNPSFPLEVSSTSTTLLARFTSNQTNAAIRIVNSSAGLGRTYSIGSGDTGSVAGNNFYIYDETGGAARFVISGSGNVGIGTTNPSGKLEIIPANTSSPEGIFVNQLGSHQSTIRFKSAHSLDSDYRVGASILVSNAFEIYSVKAAASRFVITNSGSIGIGTTTPTTIGGYNAITLNGTDGSFVDFRYNNSGYGRVFASATTALGMESLSTTLPLVFKTQNGGGSIERMRIDPSGIVTKPFQPAFNAGKNTNSTVSAGATVVFQLTTGNKFNVGGHYNASTGIFTAPVAGIYDFSASIIWMNVPNGTAMDDSFWIYKNGDIVAYGLRRAEYESTYTGNGGYFVDFANVLLSLAVGDTVKVVNNRTLEIHGNTAYSYFQGYMLG
jgi:hypothetical protein